MQQGKHTQASKKIKIKPALLIAAGLAAVIVLAAFLTLRHYLNLLNYTDSTETISELEEDSLLNVDDSEKSEEILAYEDYADENLETVYDDDYIFTDDVFHVLLVGVDTREAGVIENSRTDTMILVSINRSQKKVVLTSFLRDSYVTIPGYGHERLNAAFKIGGSEKLCETIEKNFKIEFDHNFAAVDFYSFIDVVNAIDGIDVNLTVKDTWSINMLVEAVSATVGVDYVEELLPDGTEGLTHLDGIQALCYARNRMIGDDRDRTSRQRSVISAVINKGSQLSLKELNDIAEIVLPNITTNMEKTDILALLSHAPEYLKYEVVSIRLPQDGAFTFNMINEMSVVCPYFTKCGELWYETVYGTTGEEQ